MDEIWSGPQRDLWSLTSTGSGFIDRYIGTYPQGWEIVGSGDINGDEVDDLVWHNRSGAQWGHWLMSGGAVLKIESRPAAPGYRLVTTGYFNADSFLDLLWASNNGDLIQLVGNGSGFTDHRMINYPGNGWRIFGAGDVDGDGRDDLLLRNPVLNLYGYWLLDGALVRRQVSFSAAAGYFPVSLADFNGDRRIDILWSSAAMDLQMLASTGSAFAHAYVGVYGGGWRPMDTRVNLH
jgi:hypothetical protein